MLLHNGNRITNNKYIEEETMRQGLLPSSRRSRGGRVLSVAAGALAVLLGAGVAAGPARAEGAGQKPASDIRLPPALTFTAYDTGSSGFNIAVAVGQMLKKNYGVDLRVLPAGNDVARFAPMKAGRAQMAAGGIGSYFAQEGVLEFAVKEWGPQPLRVALAVIDCNALSIGVAADAGVKQLADLRGKRVGVVVGAPALNQGTFSIMAFAGLTPQDVKLVEFSGYGAMWKGVVNNEIDAAFASTISGQAREAESSPRGLVWPPAPASDAAGWERLRRIAPYFYPHKTTCGAGIARGETIELPAYPYPIFLAYASQPKELVEGVTAAMIRHFDEYRDAAPGAAGLDLKRQKLTWVLPYHDGAVAAFRAAGVWTDEHERHNQRLVARQETLARAWKAFLDSSPPDDREVFRKAWMQARAKALAEAGMDVVFTD
ncbi:TAXI family TRAP transporter solute-binding subunit [Camelimonas abortus]|uniref:TAXI family TRAP transporter solute-binding subunit n=1 Tax=Camelimonas abortus TaxID=1017184 RepID=A0ABV7LBH0_9HYPH